MYENYGTINTSEIKKYNFICDLKDGNKIYTLRVTWMKYYFYGPSALIKNKQNIVVIVLRKTLFQYRKEYFLFNCLLTI